MFKIFNVPGSPKKGGGVIKIYDELLSPNVACFKIDGDPESPHHGGV